MLFVEDFCSQFDGELDQFDLYYFYSGFEFSLVTLEDTTLPLPVPEEDPLTAIDTWNEERIVGLLCRNGRVEAPIFHSHLNQIYDDEGKAEYIFPDRFYQHMYHGVDICSLITKDSDGHITCTQFPAATARYKVDHVDTEQPKWSKRTKRCADAVLVTTGVLCTADTLYNHTELPLWSRVCLGAAVMASIGAHFALRS